jgi:hypothetical protein
VLQATPPAKDRAKAYFRRGQAEFGLANYREAWAALVSAQVRDRGLLMISASFT